MHDVSFESLITRTVQQLIRGIGAFLPVTILLLLPSGVLAALVAIAQENGTQSLAGCLSTSGLLLLNVVLTQIVTAGISYGVFRGMRGEHTSFGDCLRLAASRWVSLVGAAFLVGLAVAGGFILLIVPGLIAMVALSVTVPALVVEKLTASNALGRSWDLTSGHRWPIFGVLFLVLVLTMVISVVLVGVQLFVGVLIASLLQFVWQVISTAFTGVFSAVAYHDLRAAREGLGEDELAAVFD